MAPLKRSCETAAQRAPTQEPCMAQGGSLCQVCVMQVSMEYRPVSRYSGSGAGASGNTKGEEDSSVAWGADHEGGQ